MLTGMNVFYLFNRAGGLIGAEDDLQENKTRILVFFSYISKYILIY